MKLCMSMVVAVCLLLTVHGLPYRQYQYDDIQQVPSSELKNPDDSLFEVTDRDLIGNDFNDIGSGVDPYEPLEPEITSGVLPLPAEPEINTEEEGTSTFRDFFGVLANKWNKFENKAKEAARSFETNFSKVFHKIEKSIPGILEKFKILLQDFGTLIHRGVNYVVHKITFVFEEGKASQIITKLEQKLEEGDEVVDDFFKLVGQKVTDWMEIHQHGDIDSGLLSSEGGLTEQFQEPDFNNIMQDREVYTQLEKMVDKGILTQDEVDVLCQTVGHTEDIEASGNLEVDPLQAEPNDIDISLSYLPPNIEPSDPDVIDHIDPETDPELFVPSESVEKDVQTLPVDDLSISYLPPNVEPYEPEAIEPIEEEDVYIPPNIEPLDPDIIDHIVPETDPELFVPSESVEKDVQTLPVDDLSISYLPPNVEPYEPEAIEPIEGEDVPLVPVVDDHENTIDGDFQQSTNPVYGGNNEDNQSGRINEPQETQQVDQFENIEQNQDTLDLHSPPNDDLSTSYLPPNLEPREPEETIEGEDNDHETPIVPVVDDLENTIDHQFVDIEQNQDNLDSLAQQTDVDNGFYQENQANHFQTQQSGQFEDIEQNQDTIDLLNQEKSNSGLIGNTGNQFNSGYGYQGLGNSEIEQFRDNEVPPRGTHDTQVGPENEGQEIYFPDW